VVKVAAEMISKLEEFEQKLSDDPELAKLVPFRITSKGANERARMAKALQSNICDDTVTALHDNHQRWMQDPSVFWTGPLPCSVDSPDPLVQIVARSLQTNPDNV
jgi:hypothetical protein